MILIYSKLGKILQKKNRSPNILKNLNITYIVLFWNYFFCSAFLSTFNKFIHNGILLSIKLFKQVQKPRNNNVWTIYRIISISSCAQSHPSSIAMRYLQRKTIMSDPNWNKGHYYDGPYPKMGMKLARSVTSGVLYGSYYHTFWCTVWLLLSYIFCKKSAM